MDFECSHEGFRLCWHDKDHYVQWDNPVGKNEWELSALETGMEGFLDGKFNEDYCFQTDDTGSDNEAMFVPKSNDRKYHEVRLGDKRRILIPEWVAHAVWKTLLQARTQLAFEQSRLSWGEIEQYNKVKYDKRYKSLFEIK
jgi:hypothetical protein